ncbi:MAG: DoxX family membrane protein [Pirellulaceae bacterium]|nr:DoxX family membrane protein [Pirellulaceae bacterium]
MLLRLSVGWHFFKEGAAKMDGGFSSTSFLNSAKGPFSGGFQAMLWDTDGKIRLCYQSSSQSSGWSEPSYNTKSVVDHWKAYQADVISYQRLEGDWAKAATGIVNRRADQLNEFFEVNHDDVIHLFNQMERREIQLKTEAMSGVTSLRAQGLQLENEIRSSRVPMLASIDLIWEGLQRELNALGTRVPLPLGKINAPPIAANQLDRFIPWFDIIVGLCLLLGLCTPVAALAGAGFLLSVILSQFPGSAGAQPTYYQTIEMCSLLVIVFTGAGKHVSLDSILGHCCCCRKHTAKPQNQTEEKE